MGFLAWVGILAALITCGLGGAFAGGAGLTIAWLVFVPKTPDDVGRAFAAIFTVLGFFGGIWLCIARFI